MVAAAEKEKILDFSAINTENKAKKIKKPQTQK